MSLRIQKYLSESGTCSRRHAEDAIRRGEVLVNGIPAHIGQSLDPEHDTVSFRGSMVQKDQSFVYYALNKPRGIETTCAQKNGKSIIDIIDIPVRVFPIGRLDKDSSGLILLTNDGRITHKLLHPSFEHEKEYLVTTYGKIDDNSLRQMSQGIRYVLTESFGSSTSSTSKKPSSPPKKKFVQTQPCEIHRVSSDTFRIVLQEGKNRQIRRMVQACGHEVKRLKRIRLEHILLSDMPEGAYRELKRGEREELLRRLGVPLVVYPPVVGVVVHGNGMGHTLGFPTANIVAEDIPDKTFSCRVKRGNELFLGAGSYQKKKGHFEVHILNFDADIYGETLHVDIMDIIRDNRAFSSPTDLGEQIKKDIHHVRVHWSSLLQPGK